MWKVKNQKEFKHNFLKVLMHIEKINQNISNNFLGEIWYYFQWKIMRKNNYFLMIWNQLENIFNKMVETDQKGLQNKY